MDLKYIIKQNEKFDNLKQLLRNELYLSERLILRLKNRNLILLNGSPVSIKSKITTDDIIQIDLNYEEENQNIMPNKMNLDIIYEDDGYIIINKPPNIPTHPSISHYKNSLSNGLKYYFDSIGLKKKIRPVNRLDKDTSGIILFAKNEYVQECLIKQMKSKDFKKEYIAILDGILKNDSGIIDAPIAREENSIIKRCISPNGDKAISKYKVLEKISNRFSIVSFILETGRTHQIRIHSLHLGYPIIGDSLYGEKSDLINRQALHSYKISFIHPITKNKVEYISPIPNDMKKLIGNK